MNDSSTASTRSIGISRQVRISAATSAILHEFSSGQSSTAWPNISRHCFFREKSKSVLSEVDSGSSEHASTHASLPIDDFLPFRPWAFRSKAPRV
jgi:hypothetical protein